MNSSPCDFHRRNGTHKGKYSAIPGLSGTACAILFFIISMLSLISCSSTDSMIDAVAYREAHRIVEYQEDQVFIYIHGSGDNPSVWADEKVRRFGGIALDWSELSMNKLSAPRKGFEVGVKIASSLGEISPDTQFLLFAHSAGAWVAQGIADGMVNTDSIEIVFLDPFTAKSIVQPFAGLSQLGKGVDTVRTYYSTIDPVPFTSGKVSGGELINVDDQIHGYEKKSDAHWSVIDIYFDSCAPLL